MKMRGNAIEKIFQTKNNFVFSLFIFLLIFSKFKPSFSKLSLIFFFELNNIKSLVSYKY